MAATRGLRARVQSVLFTNWPVKLTALVLAAVLWAAVAAEEPTTQLVPVNLVVEPPPGRQLSGTLPTVQAIYVGVTRELIKLYTSPPAIRKVIPDTLTGTEFPIELTIDDLLIGGDVDARAQEVEPRTFVVTLDDVTRRTVRVSPRVRIVPDSGYTLLGGVAMVPSRVTVHGPDSVVRSVNEVATLPVELTGVREPVRRTVALDTLGLGAARVTPQEVEVSADVVAVSERVLMGVPIVVQADEAGWVADPPAVIITVRGPSARIVHLTRDSVSVVAAQSGGTEPDTVALQLVAPSGITAVATPDTTVLVRRIRG